MMQRLKMLNWMIVPLIVLWVTINYVLGLFNQPQWKEVTTNVPARTVLGSETGNQGSGDQEWVWQGGGLVTMWFDDGWLSQFRSGFSLMYDAGFAGALAVPTDLIGYEAYMTWAQIRQIAHFGWEIDSHSRTHNCEPGKLSDAEIAEEVRSSRKVLADYGFEAHDYVLPCGSLNAELVKVVKEEYLSMRTSDGGINPLPVKDPYDIYANAVQVGTSLDTVNGWLQEAKAKKGWVILMFHQIDDSKTQYSVDVEKFDQIIHLVKESGLQVALPEQALDISPADLMEQTEGNNQ